MSRVVAVDEYELRGGEVADRIKKLENKRFKQDWDR